MNLNDIFVDAFNNGNTYQGSRVIRRGERQVGHVVTASCEGDSFFVELLYAGHDAAEIRKVRQHEFAEYELTG